MRFHLHTLDFELVTHQPLGPCDQLIQIVQSAVERRLPGECEQVAHDLPATAALHRDDIELLQQRLPQLLIDGGFSHRLPAQPRESENTKQRIVDFVRYRCGQFAERGHLLASRQSALSLLQQSAAGLGQVGCHLIEGFGHVAEFVLRPDGQPVTQVPSGHAAGAFDKILDWPVQDRPYKCAAHQA